MPVGAGPGGHTQRLLTVVKSGSIQDVKATPVDKVHTWPHLLLIEFVAALGITAFLLFFSIFVNALNLTGSLYMLQVYDRVLGARSEHTLLALTILVAFLFLAMGLIGVGCAPPATRPAMWAMSTTMAAPSQRGHCHLRIRGTT